MLRNAPRDHDPDERGAVARWRQVVIVALWCATTVGGAAALTTYATEPGATGSAPSVWPAGTAIPDPDGQPLLIMFAHPRCPCSRASIRELARIMPHAAGRMSCRVMFMQPQAGAAGWARTSLWEEAVAIPGVIVAVDYEGAEARRFGATTSGHVLVYGANGRRLFSGGITAARGHEGGSVGRSAVIDLALGRIDSAAETTPVFGCALSLPLAADPLGDAE